LPTAKALALVVGALALVVTSFAGTAGATPDGAGRPEGDGTIHQTLPIAADSFQQEDDCGSITEGTAWHFILTGAASPAGSTLTATFEDAGTTSAAVARVTGDAAHYYLATADGDVLTAASVDTGDGQLQLSHVCDAGEPEDTEDAEDAELVCPDGMVPPTGEGLVDEDEDGVYADNCVEVDDDETDDDETGDADVDATLECGVLTATSTKDISNLVIEFADGSTEKLDGLTGLEYEVDLAELFPGREVVAVYVKSGDNGTQGTGEKVVVSDTGADCDTEDTEDAELVCPDGMVPPTGEDLVDEDEDGVYADNCVEVDDDETELECPAGMNPPVGGVLVDGDDADELADNCVGSTVVVEVPRNDTGGETPNVPNVPETPGTDVEGDEVVKTPTSPIPTVTPGPVSTPEPVAVPDTPRVLGDTVTRSAAAAQLPRTGTETGLVPFGLALLLVGFALERTAKRAGRIA